MNKGCIIWTTGLSGSGKTTLTERLAKTLRASGERRVELLDGDEVRTNLSKGLTFSREDRDINIRRIGFVADLLARNGVIVLTAAISPFRAVRDELKEKYPDLLEVYVNAPLEECIRRDVKGLYKKAIAGEIKQFTGISDPYEEPTSPNLELRTDLLDLDECEKQVLDLINSRGY